MIQRTLLNLTTLRAAWDDQEEEFSWDFAANGLSAGAVLPFGRCLWRITVDEDAREFSLVEFIVEIDKSACLHHLEVRYLTAFKNARRVFTPYLRPKENQVIADQIFRSPFLYAQSETDATGLIPDLSRWPEDIKTYLDFRRDSGDGRVLLAHGVGHWKTTGHVFFKKMKTRSVAPAGTKLKAAHFLFAGKEKDGELFGRVLSFMWKRYARKDDLSPQALPLDEYDKRAARRIFAPDLFRRFRFQGKDVAAMITQTLTAGRKPDVMGQKGLDAYLRGQKQAVRALRFIQKYVFTNPVGNEILTRVLHLGLMKIAPMTMFQCWFNQARTALGSALHARRIGNMQMFDDAARIIELALAAPVDEGCVPSVCVFPDMKARWIRGTRAFELIDRFHLPDAAVTGFHLLEWHRKIGSDSRIVAMCETLARFFIARQDAGGAFPAWARPAGGNWIADDDLAQSASTAAPAMMLAALCRVSANDEYFQAASRAVEFIEKQVMPADRWFDYELFYSCAGRPTGNDGPDPFTGCYPMNTLSMYWAARACLDLYFAKRQKRRLDLARRIVSRLSSFQQVCDHPRVSMDTYGGFAVMNADAEFNDARQGLFVPLYTDMYEATGEAEYFQRAVAALRACYATMITEENREAAPGNMIRFRASDRGAVLENYGHTGRDEPSSGYLSPDWGCGTSLYASGLTLAKYGQVYIDVERKYAFGIDRCAARFVEVKNKTAFIEVDDPLSRSLEIVVRGEGGLKIMVNGISAKFSRKRNRYVSRSNH